MHVPVDPEHRHDIFCRKASGLQREPDPTCAHCVQVMERYERIAGHRPLIHMDHSELPVPARNGKLLAAPDPNGSLEEATTLARAKVDAVLARRRLRRELKVLEVIIQVTMAFTATMCVIGFLGFVALVIAVVVG